MSDHIPDATKMISDTPRTDAAYFKPHATMYDLASEMKRIERELNAANQRIKNLQAALCTVEKIDKVNAYQDLESANERIKRLEEAGDKLSDCADQIGWTSCESPQWIKKAENAVKEWRKAKEAKL